MCSWRSAVTLREAIQPSGRSPGPVRTSPSIPRAAPRRAAFICQQQAPPFPKARLPFFPPVINQLSKLVDRFLNSIVTRGRVRAIYQNSNYQLSKTFLKFQFGLVCSAFLLDKRSAPILFHIRMCVYIHICGFFPAPTLWFWRWCW